MLVAFVFFSTLVYGFLGYPSLLIPEECKT
jgi:hypothetical protein